MFFGVDEVCQVCYRHHGSGTPGLFETLEFFHAANQEALSCCPHRRLGVGRDFRGDDAGACPGRADPLGNQHWPSGGGALVHRLVGQAQGGPGHQRPDPVRIGPTADVIASLLTQ